MSSPAFPIAKELVLLGGGHAHVAVLKSFGLHPRPGCRLTLISKEADAPYSGMLPGLIAGHHHFEAAHIALRPLCRFAGARFIQATVTGLDLARRQVLCAECPPVPFDLLSINTGSTPDRDGVPGVAEFALPAKPVQSFLRNWEDVLKRVEVSVGKPFRVIVVGGGAGGVELILAARQRLRQLLLERGESPDLLEFQLVTATPTILPTHKARARAAFVRILQERGVRVWLSHEAVRIDAGVLHCQPGGALPFDALIWVTTASAPKWPGAAGLRTDERGFIAVNDYLQSISHPFVFAVGDVAAVANHPRPKSGVFAVRQGRPLGENLRRALRDEPLRPFAPQKQFLSIIGTGDGSAVASRGRWSVQGAWVWRWKKGIDRRWIRQYQELPAPFSGEK